LRPGYRLREQPTWPFAIFLPMKATLSPDVEATEQRFGRLDDGGMTGGARPRWS